MRFFGMEPIEQGGDPFDQWLAAELHKADTSSELSTVPAPRYASMERPRHRGRVVAFLAGLGAVKVALAGGAVVALAAGGLVTAKAVTTGDPNPFGNWGSTVTQQVQTCKSDLGQDQHGIGQCVSSTAKQHGEAVSSAHAGGNGGANSSSSPSPHPTGKPSSAPGHGSSHPTGEPSATPPAGSPEPSAHAGTVPPTGTPAVVPPTPRP